MSTVLTVLMKIPDIEGSSDISGFEKYIKINGTRFPEFDKSISYSNGGPTEGKKVTFSNVSYLVDDKKAINQILEKIKPGMKIKTMIEVVLVNAPADGAASKQRHARYFNSILKCGAPQQNGKLEIEIITGFVELGIYKTNDKSSAVQTLTQIDVQRSEVLDKDMTAEKAAQQAVDDGW
ncbi:MAG: hypothetical protein K2X39_07000 [Silvanigrellaceae bacterium]|nr:hypothetical protein [Silvanigrellaceae bacterium]